MTHFDYFVIGAGSGGVRSARIAASLGANVGIAEGRHIGGTCVNIGCVPKKLMAYAADFHAEFEDSIGYGWSPGKASFDWNTLIANKNKEIHRLNGIYEGMLEKNGVRVFKDYARFTSPKTLQVGNDTITADKILIATGAKPKRGTFPGAEKALVSDDLFFLKEQPEHILIVGGGYVAVEFAHIFKGLGSKVTLIYRGDLYLRGFDDDIRLALAEEMKLQGIDLRFSCDIDRYGDKAVLTDGSSLPVNHVLLAIGREANLDNLGIDLTMQDRLIKVDENYQTSAPDVYAVGDVANSHHLTPVATAEGMALAHHLFGKNKKPVNYTNIPTAVFSRPALSTAGLSEKEAREKGYAVTIFKTRFRPMKNTLSGREERTLMKLVVDSKTDKVLGVHMIGTDAPEIMQGFAVALNAGATKADFDRTIGIHPSSAEEFVTMREAVN